MDDDQQFCLRWNNHQSTLISVFDTLLENETLVDCTLAAEGKFLKAHKVVLSACSPYFATLLQEQYDKHPIFILKDVKYQELRAMMDYMYRGEVNISQDQLAALLKAAESLQIKGLSDNRSGGNSGASGNTAAAAQAAAQQATKSDAHHRVKLSGTYTLEQTKRSRGAMDVSGDVSGSREGSSSPSRRRRKVRRRSMENDMHDNSNSSVLQAVAAASNQSILQQTSASLAASALVSTQLASGSSVGAAAAATNASGSSSIQVSTQPLTSSSSNVTKKTESAKLTSTAAQGAQQQQQQQQQQTTSDAINTDNVQQQQQQQQNESTQGEADEMDVASGGAGVASGAVAVHPGVVKQLATLDKSNHKQKIKDNSITTTATTEMVIEPKAEYDEDAHDENVEDLTLDEEDMTMEELDQAAGTSQGGDGSSQAYATWQHDRSQDELGLMAAQDAQQRDPQDDNGQLDAGESRIRVRNWLMLADQSIIDKTSEDSTDKLTPSKKTNTNAAKNTTNNAKTPAGATPTTMTISTTPASVTRALNSSSNHNNSSNSNNNTSSNNNNMNSEKSCLPVTQTVTRIGSIGRTTIACITPASLKNSSSNCNVDAASAAALAAAGVELDSIDDAMTEVIVKIENPENVSLNGDEAVCNEAIDDENTFDYDLKLASPLSWTYDAVKIENEEFEDSYLMDNDDDDDDLLTTAAASQKHAKQSKSNNNGNANNNNSGSKIVLSSQQQQQLLDQQQHLQHLQLQPTSQSSLQIKLPTIPATITTIAAPTSKQQPIASTSGGANANSSSGGNSTVLSSNKMALNVDAQNLNLHWSHTDDNRYRILVQNKRMRKESLEHSADMIYNADIEKPWVCRNCNRTYKWKNSLKCHLKNECGLPPRYFCSKMCGYATNVHSNLKRHLNTKCRDREKEEEEKEKEKEKEKKYNVTAVPATTTTSVNVNTSSSGSSSNGNTSTYTLVFPNK